MAWCSGGAQGYFEAAIAAGADAFLTGVLATAIASPCTAPFMGASLGLAIGLPAVQALAVFGALGLGMALPYLVASWWPAIARALPRPGAWMAQFRQFMAFPMFATVVWLLWVLGQQSGIDGAAALLMLLLALALLVWSLGLSGKGRVVLGGLDEGVWPVRTLTDAFLNRPMRERVGLNPPERRIGQSAHDFVQALGHHDALITRAAKREGAPTVPSRFLQRLGLGAQRGRVVGRHAGAGGRVLQEVVAPAGAVAPQAVHQHHREVGTLSPQLGPVVALQRRRQAHGAGTVGLVARGAVLGEQGCTVRCRCADPRGDAKRDPADATDPATPVRQRRPPGGEATAGRSGGGQHASACV